MASIFGVGVGTALLVCSIPAWIVASIFGVGVGTALLVCIIPAWIVASIFGVRVGSAVGPQAKVKRTISETRLYPFKVLIYPIKHLHHWDSKRCGSGLRARVCSIPAG